jgi:ABC-2 type transport system ATP-binding protein
LNLQAPLTQIPASLQQYELELSEDRNDLIYTYDTQQSRTGITALLADLNDADIRFSDLQTSQSSLEDIFVDLVNRDR